MASYYILSIFFLSTLLATTLAVDLINGERVNYDYHLEREFVRTPAKPNEEIKEKRSYKGNNYNEIVQVKCTDYNENKGAKATITGGGPGYSHVEIEFTSPPGLGLNYTCDLYAAPY